MSDLRIDVLMGTSLDDLEGQCRARMATGVDGLFTFEGQHDPFLPLAIAANTVEADLMTNVAIAFPRSPMQLANVAYDLQVLSGGRFKLGLGSQVKPAIEKRFGAQWSQPVPRMREWVLATKAIFAAWEGTAKLDFRGEFTTHTLMTPNFNPGPNPYGPPPVLIGVLGPRMTEVAAEVADGVLVMPFNSARHLAENTMPAIERGMAKGGRAPGDVDVICEAIVCAGRTEEESRRRDRYLRVPIRTCDFPEVRVRQASDRIGQVSRVEQVERFKPVFHAAPLRRRTAVAILSPATRPRWRSPGQTARFGPACRTCSGAGLAKRALSKYASSFSPFGRPGSSTG